MRLRSLLAAGLGVVALLVVAGTPDPFDLTRRLADRSARRRDEAARELAALGAAAAPALERAASSPDPEVRGRARALLVLLSDPARDEARARAAEAAVSDALRSAGGLDAGSGFDARLAALEPESGRALAAAARRLAERAFVPRSFACALARHAGAEPLAALAVLVRDERMFPSAGLAAARELDARLAADPDGADVLRAEAALVLPALETAMASRNASTRRAAVALYGAVAGGSLDRSLAEVVRDTDAAVRAETARVMGRYAPGELARALRRLAADPSAEVRETALDALRSVPGAPHPEPAVAAAEDESPAVRAAAARLLARDATPGTLCVLDALATDPSDRVRAAARRSLAALRE